MCDNQERKQLKSDSETQNPNDTVNKTGDESGQLKTLPVDRFTSDSSRLLAIFPEEIWDIILTRVKDPQHLEAVSNSSPYFHHLLSPRRTTFLFPNVFTHLLAQLDDQSRVCKKFLVTCRGVSKLWNKTVDAFLESQFQHFKTWTYDPANHRDFGTYHWSSQRFSQSGNITRCTTFMEHFSKTHEATEKNPFISRSIKIKLYFGYGDNQFHSDVSRMLQFYGNHVWFASISLSDTRRTRMHCYRKLKELLDLMPSLKVLDVRYGTWTEWSKTDIPELERESREHPIPTLANLQLFSGRGLPAPLLNQVVMSNKHLKMLRVCKEGSENNSALMQTPLPNLTQLEIEFGNMADFLNLGECSWKLTSLSLRLESTNLLWDQIFDLIKNKWERSLTDLKVGFPNRNLYARFDACNAKNTD